MFQFPLYPDDTREGEVVSYNGDGGVDARDVLYVLTDVPDTARVAIFAEGKASSEATTDPRFYFDLPEESVDHYLRWQGDTDGAYGAEPKLFLAPAVPNDQDDGYTHIVAYAKQVSPGSGEATSLFELNVGDTEYLEVKADKDHKGLRRRGSDFILDMQWVLDADSSSEHIVEAFRNKNADYATTDPSNTHQFRVFGKSQLLGNVSIGNSYKAQHYIMPTGRPDQGTTVPWPVEHVLPIHKGTGEDVKWYRLKAGANVTLNYGDTLQELEISCSGGGGSSVEVDVVTDVTFDNSHGLVVTYAKITVQAEDASPPAQSYVGSKITDGVVIDNRVGTDGSGDPTLEQQRRAVWILGGDGAGAFLPWHTGTEC